MNGSRFNELNLVTNTLSQFEIFSLSLLTSLTHNPQSYNTAKIIVRLQLSEVQKLL